MIAGPNGAGKTTFAREFLPKEAHVMNFVNVDLIASGLSPLRPEFAKLAAGRIFLQELERLAGSRSDFAFESTLSGVGYVQRIKKWKASGYKVEIIFLRLNSVRLALQRVATRVRQGGHHVSKEEIIRRFGRGRQNFIKFYQPLADAWAIYDNSAEIPVLIEQGP